MSQIAESLQLLSQAATTVPAQISTLIQKLTTLQSEVEGLVNNIEEKQSQATNFSSQIQSTFDQIQAEIVQHQTQLESAIGEIETTFQSFIDLVSSNQDELVGEVQLARENVVRLNTLLNTRSEALTGVNEEVQSVLAKAHGKFQAEQESLLITVNQAEEVATQLQQNLASSQTSVNEQVLELTHSLEVISQETDSSLANTIDQFSQQRSQFNTQLISLAEQNIRQQVDQMLDETDSQIRSDLKPTIEQGLDTLISAITGIDDDLEGANSNMSNGRKVMREAIDQLEPLIDKVRDGVMRAQDQVSSLI